MEANATIRIAVVDDDESVRRALRRLILSFGYSASVFESAESFLASGPLHQWSCLVLDVMMPEVSGFDLLTRLEGLEANLSIVFLTGQGDIPMSVQAMRRGAIDFLTKPADETALRGAIERASQRTIELRKRDSETQLFRRGVELLSKRESEVLRCLLTGALNKQIAGYLGITEKTVKVHRARVLWKMGTPSLVELTRACEALGIEPDDSLIPNR